MQKQKALQEENKRLMGAYYTKTDYVCARPDGTVLSPNYVSRTFHSVITTLMTIIKTVKAIIIFFVFLFISTVPFCMFIENLIHCDFDLFQ